MQGSIFPKDIYEYITNFADDETIINLLSTNTQLRDNTLFERIMRRRYPLLIRYKKLNEDWINLYLRMAHYILKLKEEFGLDYVPSSKLDPQFFYYSLIIHPEKAGQKRKVSKREVIVEYLPYVATAGSDYLLTYYERYGSKITDNEEWLDQAVLSGDIKLLEYFEEQFKLSMHHPARMRPLQTYELDMASAVESRDSDMIEYVQNSNEKMELDKDDILERALLGAVLSGDLELVKYYHSFIPESYIIEEALEYAAEAGNIEVLKYVLSHIDDIDSRDLMEAEGDAIQRDYIDIVVFIRERYPNISDMEENLEIAQDYHSTDTINYLKQFVKPSKVKSKNVKKDKKKKKKGKKKDKSPKKAKDKKKK